MYEGKIKEQETQVLSVRGEFDQQVEENNNLR